MTRDSAPSQMRCGLPGPVIRSFASLPATITFAITRDFNNAGGFEFPSPISGYNNDASSPSRGVNAVPPLYGPIFGHFPALIRTHRAFLITVWPRRYCVRLFAPAQRHARHFPAFAAARSPRAWSASSPRPRLAARLARHAHGSPRQPGEAVRTLASKGRKRGTGHDRQRTSKTLAEKARITASTAIKYMHSPAGIRLLFYGLTRIQSGSAREGLFWALPAHSPGPGGSGVGRYTEWNAD